MNRTIFFAAAISGLLVVPLAAHAQNNAVARLVNSRGERVGRAEFSPVEKGVRVKVTLEGLEPGMYALHIHEKGACEQPDFSSAGEHFNPGGKQHGFLNPGGPHAGDLPNVTVGSDGAGVAEFVTGLISLKEGDAANVRGKTVVLHSEADDYITDPAGSSGDRVACGLIE